MRIIDFFILKVLNLKEITRTSRNISENLEIENKKTTPLN